MDVEASNTSPLKGVLSANASPNLFYLASYTILLHPFLFYRDDSIDTLDLASASWKSPAAKGLPPVRADFFRRVIALDLIKSPLSTCGRTLERTDGQKEQTVEATPFELELWCRSSLGVSEWRGKK